MAHERIYGQDLAGNVIVQWNDDGGVVTLGMIWDNPDGPNPPSSTDPGGPNAPTTSQSDVVANAAAEPGSGQTSGVVERRVEADLGGEIAVPTAVEPYRLQAYQDSTGQWSIYMGFDRAAVNTLIRALRRGRNKAFGEDE